jgi:hypothetical protein
MSIGLALVANPSEHVVVPMSVALLQYFGSTGVSG